MKKIFILALAALFVAGMIAETAVADDRLQLSGQMRVRAWDWSTKAISLGIDDEGDLEGVADDSDQNYFDQRFRLGAEVNVADGVKGVLRFDFTEDTWGSDNWGGSRYGEGSELQVDRAYLQVDKGMIGVTAGQQLITLGATAEAYDNQGTGIKLQIKTPVLITLGYTKESERGSVEDEKDDGTEDLDTALINVGYAADNFSVDGFYATYIDGQDDGIEANVFGVAGTMTMGMLAFKAELDIFGGDVENVDVMGTQFWANAEASVADNIKVGADLVYSDGNDSDDEIKITALTDFGDFGIMDRGPFNTDIMPGGASDVFDPTPYGMAGDILGLVGLDELDGVAGSQSGAVGGGAYVVYTAMEGLDFSAQAMYLAADEDWLWDDVMVLNIGGEWFFAPNTSLAAQWSHTDWSSDAEPLDDAMDVLAARLQINF